MDWSSIISGEPAEEEEMSSLAIGFAAWLRKRAASCGLRVVGLEDVTTPISDGKRLKRSSLDEEA